MALIEPLDAVAAKQLIQKILKEGHRVSFSQHALDELARDDITTVDAVNVARGGVVEPPELEKGSWRYRVWTQRLTVVVAFRSETHLRFVTGWRNKR